MSDDPAIQKLRRRNALPPFKHTRQRLREHYKLPMTASEYLGLCAAIHRDFEGLDAQPANEGRYRVFYTYKSRQVLFVYEMESRLVITALPAQNTPKGAGVYYGATGRRRKLRGPARQQTQSKHRPDWLEEWE